MSKTLDVFLLPSLIGERDLVGRAAVLIDVLRATTTIITALYHGAAQIIPSDDIDRARETARQFQPRALLGGERNGLKIDGFDLGNSPLEYTDPSIVGRTIVLATTNGTRAMFHCREADRVVIGSFANISPLVQELSEHNQIALVCSGTDGRVTAEDVLVAGCLVDRLTSRQQGFRMNDQATMACSVWLETWQRTGDAPALARAMGGMHGGRNLVKRGMGADIDFCAMIDRFDLTPQLDLHDWSIRAAPSATRR